MQIGIGLFLIALCAIGGFYGGVLVKDGLEKKRAEGRSEAVDRPLLNIKPFQYSYTQQYFSIEVMDPQKGNFVLQFQLEIHNVGKYIAKDITFLKCEVRGPRNQIKTPSAPIISSDMGPDAKYYARFYLDIAISPANFSKLPSGKIQIIHDFSTIEFDVVLKYLSALDPKKEYRIDASYRISADSVEIIRYQAF